MEPARPSIRFCLAIEHGIWKQRDAAAAVERTFGLARLADEAGMDSLWLTEDPDGWDAFALLGAMARETSRLRLGTGVTNAFNRSPNQIAASTATLDRISGGRAFLGIGRGQPEIYGRVFGDDVTHPLQRLADTIGLLRQWWSGEGVAHGDGLVDGASWRRTILPVSRPPIYIAAVGPKALKLAGEIADGVLFNELATPAFVRLAVETVHNAARAVNRDPTRLQFFANPAVTVTDDPAPVLERKKATVALIHALPGMDRLLMSDNWDVSEIMARVRELMKTRETLSDGGHFFEIMRDGDLEAAREVLPSGLVAEASAIGPIEYVKSRIVEYQNAGATHLFLNRRGIPADVGELASQLNALRTD